MPTYLDLPRPHAGQKAILRDRRRFNVLACGRRFGKTSVAQPLLLEPAIKRGLPTAYFSPTYKTLTDVWRDMVRVAHPVTASSNSSDHRLELINGSVIEMWSLDNPNAGRGRKYARAIIDEAAMVRHLKEAWTAAIRPTLADYEGDAYFLSTPKGLNYFYELYMRGIKPEGQPDPHPDWISWRRPTLDNPFIAATEVEAARLDLPERIFAQEYLAEFLENEGAVFRRVMESCTATPQAKAIPADYNAGTPAHQYVMGVDWGKLNDYTVITVIDTTTRELVYLERFNQIDYTLQRARLMAVWEKFARPPVYAESNSIGLPVIEELIKAGVYVVPFQTTNASKAQVIEGLALAFEQGSLQILPDPILTSELLSYEAERLPSGLLRYGAPEGKHDDTVMALAICWYGASIPSQVEYGPDLWS